MRDLVVHRSGVEIDLQAPDSIGAQLIREIMARKRRPRCEEGELVCQRHGAPLYLREPVNAPIGCHWPHSGFAGEQHPVALMSVEHKIQTEYIARAAEREGLPVALEKTLPTHVRPDLVVNGDTAFEVQRSHISVSDAKRRTTMAVRGGMSVSLWVSDRPRENQPKWMGEIPSVSVWAPGWMSLPGLGAAKVTNGLRELFLVRHHHDTARCTQRGKCGGWHLKDGPSSATLDRLSVGLAVGEYIPVRMGRWIRVVSKADAEQYDIQAWTVAPRPTKRDREATEAGRIACRSTSTSLVTCCGERSLGDPSRPLVPECMLCPKSATYWKAAS